MRRYLFLLCLLLLPLFEGGNSAPGLLIGLVAIPLLFAWEAATGGLRLAWKPLAAWIGFAFIALLATTYLYPTLRITLWLLSAAFAFSLAAHYLNARKLGGVDITLPMAISGLLTALYGLFLYSPNFSQPVPGAQLSSVFGLHNSYAAFLLLAWPLAIAVVRQNRRQSFILWAGVMLVAFFLTFSRAAYIAFVIQLGVLAWMGSAACLRGRSKAPQPKEEALRRRIHPATLAVIGGLIAVFFFFAVTSLPQVTTRIASIWNAADYSLQGRLTFWAVSWEMFLAYPLQGAGLGAFGYHYTYLQPSWHYFTTDPHSFAMQILAEMGVVGIIFAAGFAWWHLRRLALSSRLVPAGSKWAHNLVLAALLGFTAHALVDFDFTYLANMVYFAVLLAVAGYPAASACKQEGRQSWLNVAAPVLAIVAAAGGILYASEKNQLAKGDLDPAAVAQAASIIPWNAATKIDLALLAMKENPPDFNLAAEYAAGAAMLNPWESQAAFIISQSPGSGTLDERIESGARAIQLDPYNRPHYYWGLSRLLRQKGDSKGELSVLLSAAQRYAGITSAIGPDFPRPHWMENNITFASIYSRLAELLKEAQPAASALYAQLAVKFHEANSGASDAAGGA